jgi:glycosyltransferase involved in cell wall biosynthesis
MAKLSIFYLGPLRPFRGGSGVVGSLLLEALARQGCAIVAASNLSAGEPALDPALTAAGIRLHAMPVALETNPWEQPDETYLAEAGLRLQAIGREIVSEQPPDILLVGRGDYGGPAMAIAEHCRRPFVIIDHGSASAHYAGFSPVPESFRRRDVLKNADCIVSVARHRTKILRQCGFRNVVTVANGTDTALFRPGMADAALRVRLGLRDDTPLVAHVSNFSPMKRVPDYLKASASLVSAGIAAHFLVVGDGPARRDLEVQACALNLDGRVTFTGWLDTRELASLLRTVDLVVQPSEGEACPLAVLEAMASGRAVVASDIAGHRENIEHDSTGVLTPVGDIAALAAAIAELLRARERRAALGCAASTAMRRRTTDAMARSYYRILSKIARQAKTPAIP